MEFERLKREGRKCGCALASLSCLCWVFDVGVLGPRCGCWCDELMMGVFRWVAGARVVAAGGFGVKVCCCREVERDATGVHAGRRRLMLVYREYWAECNHYCRLVCIDGR